MPDTKISALGALSLASASGTDLLPIVDVNDTSMSATGTDKSITLANLGGYILGKANFVKGVVVDGGGQAITSGSMGKFQIPCNCTLSSWTCIAEDGVSGSVTWGLNQGPLASYNSLTSFVGSGTAPYLSSEASRTSTNFSNYIYGISSSPLSGGNYIEFVIQSISGGITRLKLELSMKPTGS